MSLDPTTLGVAFLMISAVLGGLLLFSWLLNRNVHALAWWGTAFCLVPFGMGLASLGLQPTGPLMILVSNALMASVYGILYAGCRAFNGRSRTILASLPGLAAWILLFPAIQERFEARLVVTSIISGAYLSLSAWELWRNARQPLVSQGVAIFLILVLTAFHVLRGVLAFAPTGIEWIDVLAMRWSSSMALFLLLYVPALAFVFLSMAKEQVEDEHKQAALVDPLTGIPNRRALFQNASELLRRLGGGPVTCLLFDLDNFKKINDTYGHEIGDHILTVFGQVLAAHLPAGSFGRMGGEEFVAILPFHGAVEARADEIRQAFARAAQTVLGQEVAATVSIGCARAANTTIDQLIHDADHALYRAKAAGRNVVILSSAVAG